MSWLRKLLGAKESLGITQRELRRWTQGDRLEEFLPWLLFKEEDHSFLNVDNTIGFVWECTPLFFLGEQQEKQLAALLRTDFPQGTVMQWLLYADPNIDHFTDKFLATKTRQEPLLQRSAEAYQMFLQAAAKNNASPITPPVRNFRLFCALKSPVKLGLDVLTMVEQLLTAADLAPRRWHANDLLRWSQQLLNGYHQPTTTVDPMRALREQVVRADTEVKREKNTLKIGDRFARCLTPANLGKSINPLKANQLFGDFLGSAGSSKQINLPFLYSLNILFDDVTFAIHKNASLTMAMRMAGSFSMALRRRIDEYYWALDLLNNGEKFVKIVPSLWLFGDTEEQIRTQSSNLTTLWGGVADITLQNESTLLMPMFIASLPLGLYNVGHNINFLARHFMVPCDTAAVLLPTQADFRGSQNPVLPYIGRKGQVIGLDLFDKGTNAHNFMVSAATGHGKSFGLNYLCANYYSAGAKVRIVDIGYSYKKLAQVLNGRFLDFGLEDICINPFDWVAKDAEDEALAIEAATNVVGEMCYSSSAESLKEEEWGLVRRAVRWLVDTDQKQRGIDAVYQYLREYPKLDGEADHDTLPAGIIDTARRLAFNMTEFTTGGAYGKYFNGPSTFNIANDDFVVIELERLRSYPPLFKVLVMQIMNAVTQDLYLSDRSSKRFILFEEAPSLLKEQGNKDLSRLAMMIEEGYRRARKYSGAFGIVMQSPHDLEHFGRIGQVIKDNAQFRFFLKGESNTYRQASEKGIIQNQGLSLELIESLRNFTPHYSELFLDTPFGSGVVRLAVDPWTYWVATSHGGEVHQFEQLIQQGLTPLQAIEQLSGEKR